MNKEIQLKLQQAFQSSNSNSANSILTEILEEDASNTDGIIGLGIAYANISRFTEAAIIFSCLQQYKKDDVRIPYNLGLIYSLQGKDHLAIDAYDLALKIQPDDYMTLINKGSTCNDIKNYALALDVLDKAIKVKPDAKEAWCNKGIALNNLSLYQESISAYEKAISLDLNYYKAWSNKSAPLSKLGRLIEASHACDKALSISPGYAEGWLNKGIILNVLRHYKEAIAHFDKALGINPNYAEGWFNKGVTLNEIKQHEEAIAHYDKALGINPGHAEGWFNKGISLYALGRYEEAIRHFDKALSLKSDIDWASGDLLHAKMKICDWNGLQESLDKISKKLTENDKVIDPFILLSLNDDALLHKKCSEIFIQSRYPFNPDLGPIPKPTQSQKIRVGYFSADFHNHATGYLMAELFELHDKSKFELVGFSFGPIVNDEMRQRLVKSFDQFIEVGEISDLDAAKLSRDLSIDIAVDLKGFTENARAGIFSYRAAPIQVNYLGYPGTMGADYIDYVIADKTLIPPELQSHYSEKVISLPNSYQVNDRKRLISDRKFTKQELGLPKNGFVFCCFNNNYKILPATFASWMRILRAVEGSVLWLFQDNSWAVENLKKEAEKQGISSDRLVFAERLPLHEHLARHRQADLFLDTFPYNAHTTTSDALWAGLPVLTLKGASFASRVAASLLNAIGLSELIVNTREEYENMAIEFALNPKKLADVKFKLANNRLASALFDTPQFTKNLEAAYFKMYERYKVDLQPEHIVI
jgi:protein O-GlcNAc transferase